MIHEGQIVLFRFPYADRREAKLRPALVIRQLPGASDDWLISMISSQLSQEVSSFDEIVSKEDSDFNKSGLKFASVIRIGRIAVVHKTIWKAPLARLALTV